MKAGLLIKSILVTIGWLPWLLIKYTIKGLGQWYRLLHFTLNKVLNVKIRINLRLRFPVIRIALPKIKIRIPRFKIRFPRIWLRIRWSIVTASIIIILLSSGGVWFYEEIIKDLPDIDKIYSPPPMSTRITDRNGLVLYKFYRDENRSWTPLGKIPQTLIEATLAIEDKDFYKHHGLSVKGILTAIRYDFTKDSEDKPRGGSTITQQLAKNIFLSNEKSWKRKLKEAILAIEIEKKLNKEEILERYFNQVPYGGDVYGVQEASQRYFGKNVWEISKAEAAYLAGLPAAPSSYSAFGDNPEYGKLRQKHVVQEMVSAHFISQKQADELLKEEINIVNENNKILAPHFVFYVKDWLTEKLGYQNFERQGLVVRTTLDENTQRMAEGIVKEEVGKVNNLHITNGAALIISPENGDILAMVGSKDYGAKDIDGKYNVTTALRQPGSSIKPINYLLALEHNWTLASLIDDSPVSYQIKGQKPYTPQNYNGRFMGRVTLKTALASSLNVPSVKLLAENGVQNMIDLGQRMGITSWNDPGRFGLSLALGSGEVKMTEISQAYAIFANMGNKVDLDPILSIQNYLGQTIELKQVESENVVEPKYAFLINSALSDDQARAPIFGLNSKLKIDGKTVAVKTGTTNSLRDNWCIGWTPSVLVAAWVGNNDNTPMSWVASGVSGATPIWNKIIREMLKNKSNENWPMPEGVVKSNTCGRDEYFIEGTEETIKCLTTVTPTPGN